MKINISPYRSDRQRAAEERAKNARIHDAMMKSEVLKRIESERQLEKLNDRILFCLWVALDAELSKLEDQRDANVPKTIDEPMNEAFMDAIEKIPNVRKACNDVWSAYVNHGRAEFVGCL